MNQRTKTARAVPALAASLLVAGSMLMGACGTSGPAMPPGPAPTITDTTVGDFAAGTATGSAVANVTGGEVVLAAIPGEQFNGVAVPTGWSSTPWNLGGAATVAGGSASVDGSLLATDATYPAGRSLEFVATFGTTTFQHVGFGQTLADLNQYWAMFSTHNNPTPTLYARTNLNGSVDDFAIPGSFIGSAHTYRIDWSATSVAYSIDGLLVYTATATIPVPLRVVASDFNVDGSAVAVDSATLSGYSSPGTFDSRVIDGGATVMWGSLGWVADLPAGTSIALSARAGGTPTPDGTWTAYSTPTATPGAITLSGRYVQYRITLTTTDDQATPVVRSVTLGA